MSSNDKRIKVINCIAAFVLLFLCLAALGGCSDKKPEPSGDIPTPTEMLYGLKYKTSVKYDFEKVKNTILLNPHFFDYELRDEYTMVYLITDEKSEADCKELLGITDELPEIDYSENNIVLSVGREIADIIDKKRTDDDGNKLISFEYEEEYHKDTVFVYRERKIDFISGLELEKHYLETLSTDCNLIEGERVISKLVAQGAYNKIYLKEEGLYEYVLTLKEEQTKVLRRFTENLPEIIEHSDTMVQVIDGKNQFFFDPVHNDMTSSTTNKLFFLKNNLVAYARLHNGQIILCIRDAYDTSKYNYGYDVPFTQDNTIRNELLVSIEYVDQYNVFIEFYGGAEKTLQTMTVKVVNMEYK